MDADDKVYVAGSAAIVPELAGDVDIWVGGKSKFKPSNLDMGVWAEKTCPSDIEGYESLPVDYRYEAFVPGPDNLMVKVQIMFLTPGTSIWDLLAQFDCCCHMFARTRAGNMMVGKAAVSPSVYPLYPHINVEGKNEGQVQFTKERRDKFVERYKNTHWGDLWLPNFSDGKLHNEKFLPILPDLTDDDIPF